MLDWLTGRWRWGPWGATPCANADETSIAPAIRTMLNIAESPARCFSLATRPLRRTAGLTPKQASHKTTLGRSPCGPNEVGESTRAALQNRHNQITKQDNELTRTGSRNGKSNNTIYFVPGVLVCPPRVKQTCRHNLCESRHPRPKLSCTTRPSPRGRILRRTCFTERPTLYITA